MANTHKGACFCGAVEIAAHGDPIDMGYCHCTSCRTYSGAPLVAFTIWPTAQVEVTKGGELLGSFNKVGTSNRKYCLRCGGHLMIVHAHLEVVDIRAAVLPTVRFQPKEHLNYAEAVLPVRDGLPKFKNLPAEIGGSGELIPE
jgi:hypothetical protein